jgi:hypothetical protein
MSFMAGAAPAPLCGGWVGGRRRSVWRRQRLMVFAAALLAGCGDAATPYREVIHDQARAFEELEQVLNAIVDQASMKAAQAEFKKRLDHCEAIKQRALSLAPPSIAIREQVYEESIRLNQVFAGVGRQVSRIKALPGGEDFLKPFDHGQGFLGAAAP